jgi:hypothetical protein
VVHETHRCKLFQAAQEQAPYEQAPYGYVQEAMQGNKSTNNDARPGSAEAGPTGDATDGRPPVASRSGRRRRLSATPTSGTV